MSAWWSAWFGGGDAAPAAPERWVVLDVETSGLDVARDRLLAIAAVGLRVDWSRRRLDVCLGDSFEVVLRQERASSRDNILLHGIGVQSQRDGWDPVEALRAFEAFSGAAPLLAFHSAFDEALIGRHARQHLGRRPANPWVDIEHLCAVTHPQVRARSLDEWMAHFGITCPRRHQAAADTLAECELLQRIWPAVAVECRNWRGVERLAGRRRWLASG
ncbi:3'-5' exonuclease [Hydrogenophaga sp. YM1]|uniref:3'-5' exonuclease n=1 Tax=Hydrogenophaga sp. YM1 TaxID=2806262 RepID=UPI0019566EFA|nr:3'-5' exonuclease [Hydrogenophaga sp. YM1]QRR35155.1 3'-5' exonuclease [Hydrogenophaga sp. YM1]